LSLLNTKRFDRVILELGMALSFPCGFGTGISLRPGYGLRFVVIQKQVVNEARFLFELEIRGLKFNDAKELMKSCRSYSGDMQVQPGGRGTRIRLAASAFSGKLHRITAKPPFNPVSLSAKCGRRRSVAYGKLELRQNQLAWSKRYNVVFADGYLACLRLIWGRRL
jgi:hypothetical protein